MEILVFVLPCAALLFCYLWSNRHVDPRRVLKLAAEEFRQLRIDAEHPAWRFDGGSAQLVHEHIEYRDKAMVTVLRVTRYARNAHGEYFYFMSEGTGRPFFKHIDQASARAALGDNYLAPPSAPG